MLVVRILIAFAILAGLVAAVVDARRRAGLVLSGALLAVTVGALVHKLVSRTNQRGHGVFCLLGDGSG